MNKIIAKHSSIIIPNYNLGDNKKIESMLSIWDEIYYKRIPVGYSYDEIKKELRVPRGLDLNYLENEFNMPIEINRDHDEFDKASIRLKIEPRNDIQKKSLCFLLGYGDFEYTQRRSQLSLNLDTGDGKTYCVIAALTYFNMKSIIITHIEEIKKQWHKSLLDMTDIHDSMILNISGSSVIDKILKSTKPLPFKVYLINHRTIQSYAKKHGWESITELFNKLRVGLKIYDEAHLEFSNIIKTDLYTNTKKTIYLTANFERSGFNENKIFDLCFKSVARFGIETRAEKRRHIIYVPVLYNSKPDMHAQIAVKGKKGFDRYNYIDYELKKDIFFNALKYVVDYISTKEGKILVLLSKIEAVDEVKKYLHTITTKSIGAYHSKMDDDEKELSLTKDIIISTPKSLGTGLDIVDLRYVIMTEQYKSRVTANQTAGRLRENTKWEYSFHFELIDTGFKKVNDMYKSRLSSVFRKKCAKVMQLQFKGE